MHSPRGRTTGEGAPSPVSDELLTATQAAERLGCSVAQVKAMCREGKLRATKFGNAWAIRAADLACVTLAKPGWPLGRKRKPEP